MMKYTNTFKQGIYKKNILMVTDFKLLYSTQKIKVISKCY